MMNPKELMLGDLVSVKTASGEKIATVHELYQNGIITKEVWPFLDDEISPVPLTLDILKKNFEPNDEDQARWGSVGCEKIFFVIPKPGWKVAKWNFIWYPDTQELQIEDDPMICIKYVHELQHVLRIIGSDKCIEL